MERRSASGWGSRPTTRTAWRSPGGDRMMHQGKLRKNSRRSPVRSSGTSMAAERMNLTEMEPRGDLSSTGYALANSGEEYLVLQPSETVDPFTVTLDAGTYTVEWY